MNLLKKTMPILAILLIAMSLFAIVLVHINAFSMGLGISSEAYVKYLSLHEPFHMLYGSSFTVIAVSVALHQMRLSVKLSNRQIWIADKKQALQVLMSENPYMYGYFCRKIIEMHDYLFERNYTFSSEADLKLFYDVFIKKQVEFFENSNKKSRHIGVYRDEDWSFSIHGLTDAMVLLIDFEGQYPDWFRRLKTLYIEDVKEKTRTIDPQVYEKKIIEYNNSQLL